MIPGPRANDTQIGPQMIPGLGLTPSQKGRNCLDSLKVDGWIYVFLTFLGEQKRSTSGIKTAIKYVENHDNAQNTKLPSWCKFWAQQN